jgi:hypothetical protein
VPKSGEHEDHIAPRLVEASIAIMVSGIFVDSLYEFIQVAAHYSFSGRTP